MPKSFRIMVPRKIALFLLFFALNLSGTTAQELGIVATSNAKKSIQVAQELIRNGDLEKARQQLIHTSKLRKQLAITFRLLGKVNLDLDRYQEAIDAFDRSFSSDTQLSRAAYFECADAYLRIGNVQMANFYYQKYKFLKDQSYANKKKEELTEQLYDSVLEQRLANCLFVMQMDSSTFSPEARNLGPAINTSKNEYMPCVLKDTLTLFFTRSSLKDNENIFFSTRKARKNWESPRSVTNAINTPVNEGMAKISFDGQQLFFTACNRPDGLGSCDLYFAPYADGFIGEPEHIGIRVNSEYWDSQASPTCDGNTIYFSSNREGGFGGADIWMTTRNELGQWTTPINLGPKVNTPFDEEGPFVAPDGKGLYFSSNGWPGMGDHDLFLSRWTQHGWSEARNLGYPVNSTCKELGLHITMNGSVIYFASSRPGGEGGLDIYQANLPAPLRPTPSALLEGNVFDIVSEDPLPGKVRIRNNKNSWQVTVHDDGKFRFCLPCRSGYSFQLNQKGYEYFITGNYIGEEHFQAIDFPLVPITGIPQSANVKKGTLQEKRIQIYFERDSYGLGTRELKDLQALVQLLDKERDWNIEILGYADPVGDATYNRALSEKRALVIAEYLKEKGILSSKILRNEGRGIDKKGANYSGRRVDIILRK